MKWKKLMAVCLAVCMVGALLTGCGNSSEPESTTTNSNNSTIERVAETTDDKIVEKTSTENAEPETENDLYAWYDELNAEWEKCGGLTYVAKFYTNYSYAIENNTYFFLRFSGKDVSKILKFFSIDKNGAGAFVGSQNEDSMNFVTSTTGIIPVAYKNGFFYVYSYPESVTGSPTLKKMDKNGNTVASIAIEDSQKIVTIFGDDSVLLYDTPTSKYYLIPSNFSNITEFTAPSFQIEGTHELMHDMVIDGEFFDGAVAYKNKLYVKVVSQDGYNGVIYLDTDEMQWYTLTSDSDSISKKYFDFHFIAGARVVGKYLLFSHSIYDMEKDEFLYDFVSSEAIYSGMNNYFGGNHHFADGTTFLRYPSDGGEPEIIESPVRNFSGFIVDSERYAVLDEYGVFVHNYDGTDEEITARLYDESTSENVIDTPSQPSNSDNNSSANSSPADNSSTSEALISVDSNNLLHADVSLYGKTRTQVSKMLGITIDKLQDWKYWGVNLKYQDVKYNGIDLCLMFQNDKLTVVRYDTKGELSESFKKLAMRSYADIDNEPLIDKDDESGYFYYQAYITDDISYELENDFYEDGTLVYHQTFLDLNADWGE